VIGYIHWNRKTMQDHPYALAKKINSTPNNAGKKTGRQTMLKLSQKGLQLGNTLIRNIHSNCRECINALKAA